MSEQRGLSGSMLGVERVGSNVSALMKKYHNENIRLEGALRSLEAEGVLQPCLRSATDATKKAARQRSISTPHAAKVQAASSLRAVGSADVVGLDRKGGEHDDAQGVRKRDLEEVMSALDSFSMESESAENDVIFLDPSKNTIAQRRQQRQGQVADKASKGHLGGAEGVFFAKPGPAGLPVPESLAPHGHILSPSPQYRQHLTTSADASPPVRRPPSFSPFKMEDTWQDLDESRRTLSPSYQR